MILSTCTCSLACYSVYLPTHYPLTQASTAWSEERDDLEAKIRDLRAELAEMVPHPSPKPNPNPNPAPSPNPNLSPNPSGVGGRSRGRGCRPAVAVFVLYSLALTLTLALTLSALAADPKVLAAGWQ